MRRALLPAVLAALLLAPGASAWTWPAGGPVLQPFLFDPAHPYAAGQHRGIDLGGAEGSPVLAPAAGTVSFAGTVPSSGKSVTIETPDGYSVTLTHLGSISVARNAAVAEGSPVGTIGPSGDGEVSQPYVHLGVRLTAQAQGYLDPLTLLPPRGAAPPADPAPVPSPSACFTAGICARCRRHRPSRRPPPLRRRPRPLPSRRLRPRPLPRHRRARRPLRRLRPWWRLRPCAHARRGSRPRGPTRGGRRAARHGAGVRAEAHCVGGAAAQHGAARLCVTSTRRTRRAQQSGRLPASRRHLARARSLPARTTRLPGMAHRVPVARRAQVL